MVNYDKIYIDDIRSKYAIDAIVYTLKNERKIDKQTFRLRYGQSVDEAIKYLFSPEERPFEMLNTFDCIKLEEE